MLCAEMAQNCTQRTVINDILVVPIVVVSRYVYRFQSIYLACIPGFTIAWFCRYSLIFFAV